MNGITYGRLDQVLRALGLTRRTVDLDGDAIVYKDPHSQAVIILPPFPDEQPVYPHHMALVETTLDNFGIATPAAFAEELEKAG